jgi:PAS domain S-box-containing protein
MREAGRVLATGSIWDSELDLADEPRIPVWASLLLVSLGGLSVLALGGVLVLRAAVRRRTRTLQFEVEESRRSEAALRESETWYRTLFETANDAIFTMEGDRFVDCNAQTLEMFRCTREQILSRSPYDFSPALQPDGSNSRKKALEKISGALAGERQFFEWRHLRGDGTPFDAEISLSRIGVGSETYLQAIVRDITERKGAESALRRSEDRFRRMADSIQDGLTIVEHGQVVYVNDRACEIFGYPREELIHLNSFDLAVPEEKERLRRAVTKSKNAGVFLDQMEFWIARKDGTLRYIQNRYSLSRVDGEVVGRYIVTTDITERQLAREALRHYAERLAVLREIDQAILSAESPEAIAKAALARIRRLIPCHRASVVLFDFERNDAVVLSANVNGETSLGTGESFSIDLFGGLSHLQQGTAHQTDLALEGAECSSVEEQLYAEGVRSYLKVPLISRGMLTGSLNLGVQQPDFFSAERIDIAQEVADQLAIAIQNAHLLERERERSAALEALRQASLHLTSTLELQPVLEAILEHVLQLVSADDAHVFLYEEARLAFGAAMWAGDFQREPYAEPRESGLTYAVARSGERIVVPDVDQEPLFQNWQWGGAIVGLPLLLGGKVRGVMNVAFEEPHLFTQDELNVLELLADHAAIAIRNARLHQDVRRHARELANALEQARELEALKSEFIQNVSHELRSPLALIRGYAELLDLGELGELDAVQKGPVEIIARRARMLDDLVEDITLILGAEARPLAREPVSMRKLAQASVEDFGVAADQAGLALGLEVASDIPMVRGEASYVRRVLDNLLSNAIKFTPAGGKVTIRLFSERDQVILQVSDTGIGIPADEQDEVFERFYQVDGSSRRRYGGVGLGLALVKEVVEALGGEVSLNSVLGEGSTFTVSLPAVPVG